MGQVIERDPGSAAADLAAVQCLECRADQIGVGPGVGIDEQQVVAAGRPGTRVAGAADLPRRLEDDPATGLLAICGVESVEALSTTMISV